jgi:chloride channel protein, CIC family
VCLYKDGQSAAPAVKKFIKETPTILSNLVSNRITSSRIASAGKWAFYYVLIGLIAGLGSIIFHYLCGLGLHFFIDQLAGYRPPAPAGEPHLFPPLGTPFNRWILLFLPAMGGIVSGWLVYTFAPEAEGHGTDAAIEAYHDKGGFVRGRIPFIKTIASALTITTGGSGGREGPIAQIGAGFGSFLATKLRLPDRERRIMLAAGMGAGIGSIFRAPLAGALFAAEVLYRDPEFESEVIIPAGISSVVAYCVFCLVFGWGSLFESPDFVFQNPLELGPYTVLALVLVAGGFLYVKSFYGIHDLFKKIRVPNHIKPAIGGLCTGAIGFFLPQTLAFGYGFAQMALDNQLPTLFLLGLALGKILTTSFSIGSGGSGGVFGPSVVIGGALGGAVGRIFHAIIPSVVPHAGAFVVVGMAGFFASVSNAPISTIIFVSEMTNSYHLLLPSMLVCTVAFLLSRRWTIYIKQVKGKLDSNAHRGDFFVDVLAAIRVKELMPSLRKAQLIPENMTFTQFREVFKSTQLHYFPVVNEEKKLTGIFSINDIRGILFDQEIGELIRMKEVATTDIIFTTPSEDLNEVLKKFTIRNLHRIPVVKDEDHSFLLGMLDRREVIQFYNQRIQEMKSGKRVEEKPAGLATSRLMLTYVKEAMITHPETIPAHMPLKEIQQTITERKLRTFPVLNETGELCGVISLSDVQAALKKGPLSQDASDIATKSMVTVAENENLFSALSKITLGDFAMLPVVDPGGPKKLLGVISRRDIMAAIGHAVVGQGGV